jgi:hypothetical protein
VPRGQRDESLRPYSRLSRPEPLLFLPSSSSVALTRLSGPRSILTTFFSSCNARESNPGPPDLWPGTLTTRPQRRAMSHIYSTRGLFWYPTTLRYALLSQLSVEVLICQYSCSVGKKLYILYRCVYIYIYTLYEKQSILKKECIHIIKITRYKSFGCTVISCDDYSVET